ncbi:MHS family proline/betaine transporter-like MFS transporter [Pseudomonas duriflava]|uniref:MHS family proline/betaine transporter-like MFS transporter n=2 Tax=Pseudomonas duriflava TaxID=459528 RepID=A0A562PXS7_9PSED|nr:MHS family proline/betaine transporter-like MFS transporter [Pseudomonas duriflava]
MVASSAVFAITIYPAFMYLSLNATLAGLLTVLVWLSLLKAMYFGGLPALIAELFPTKVRATGMALSYNIGTTVFGSFTPFFITWLIGLSGSKMSPAFYLLFTGLLSLVALMTIRHCVKLS